MALSCGNIGLAPIAEIEFNLCRSSIKWAEYAAIGAACVATDYGPYQRDCENGKDAILCKSREEWAEALKTLLWYSGKREEIAKNALAKVKREYNLDFVADRWIEVFQQVNEK
jgi:glycosyltransferase involved in cell wall biosynthesis